MLVEGIREIARTMPAELKEREGLFVLEFIVAERRVFLSRRKLIYRAKFRIDDNKKEVRFTEMLKEVGSGLSTGGDIEASPGFGFKIETYKTKFGARQGTIQEQSNLFGKHYKYKFDFSNIRTKIEAETTKAGYTFRYQLTSFGL